jgi:hypothetical protein
MLEELPRAVHICGDVPVRGTAHGVARVCSLFTPCCWHSSCVYESMGEGEDGGGGYLLVRPPFVLHCRIGRQLRSEAARVIQTWFKTQGMVVRIGDPSPPPMHSYLHSNDNGTGPLHGGSVLETQCATSFSPLVIHHVLSRLLTSHFPRSPSLSPTPWAVTLPRCTPVGHAPARCSSRDACQAAGASCDAKV